MTASARRIVVRLPRARREQDILDAAHAVFEERGYEAAAVSEIADRAGVVEGTVYKYFESKRGAALPRHGALVRGDARRLRGAPRRA